MTTENADIFKMPYRELQGLLRDLRDVYGCKGIGTLNRRRESLENTLQSLLECQYVCVLDSFLEGTFRCIGNLQPEALTCDISTEIEAYESGEDIAFYSPDELYPDENGFQWVAGCNGSELAAEHKLAKELLAKLFPRTENATKSKPYNYCVELWSFVARNRVIILDYTRLARNAIRFAYISSPSSSFYQISCLSNLMFDHINLYFSIGFTSIRKLYYKPTKPFFYDKAWNGSSIYSNMNEIQHGIEKFLYYSEALQAVDELAGITS